MISTSERTEPVISFGAETTLSAPVKPHIERAPRHAPTGTLTRNILRQRFRGKLEKSCHGLNLSKNTLEALLTEVTRREGSSFDNEAIAAAMRGLFSCEPIVPTTPHPILLVGGVQATRMRVALALSQRTEWSGRRVALYSMQQGQFPTPLAIYAGGLDILYIGTVNACIDAVQAREPNELAVIDASCLDNHADNPSALEKLALSLNAEAIYVDDGHSTLPELEHLSRIERVILSSRSQTAHFGALLDTAYKQGWSFAGHCSKQGVYHPMTPEMLAERFAQALHCFEAQKQPQGELHGNPTPKSCRDKIYIPSR